MPGHEDHPADASAHEVIRAFIADCGGDLSDDTTDLTEQLRSRLAAAGVLTRQRVRADPSGPGTS